MSRHGFTSIRLCNLDEVGNSTVLVPSKSICSEEIKIMSSMTSEETGINVTMIVAVNAIGNHIPPMFIFSTVHLKNCMLTAAPTASVAGSYPAIWSNESLFIDSLK
jgi:hypothetical protein